MLFREECEQNILLKDHTENITETANTLSHLFYILHSKSCVKLLIFKSSVFLCSVYVFKSIPQQRWSRNQKRYWTIKSHLTLCNVPL